MDAAPAPPPEGGGFPWKWVAAGCCGCAAVLVLAAAAATVAGYLTARAQAPVAPSPGAPRPAPLATPSTPQATPGAAAQPSPAAVELPKALAEALAVDPSGALRFPRGTEGLSVRSFSDRALHVRFDPRKGAAPRDPHVLLAQIAARLLAKPIEVDQVALVHPGGLLANRVLRLKLAPLRAGGAPPSPAALAERIEATDEPEDLPPD